MNEQEQKQSTEPHETIQMRVGLWGKRVAIDVGDGKTTILLTAHSAQWLASSLHKVAVLLEEANAPSDNRSH